METSAALDAARTTTHSVLVTLRDDGRPQLSNVMHHVDAEGVIRISVTDTRAKTVNLRKRPWAALKFDVGSFWSYAVLEGDVQLSAVSAATDDEVVEELVQLYRDLAGEHPDWDEYRAVQVSEGRLVVRIRPTYAYGMLQVQPR